MLSVATWNVNSLKARAAHVQRFLDSCAPDVLMIQEVKGAALAAGFTGYDSAAVLQKAYNGVAVFSRLPFEVVSKSVLEGDDQARYLEVALATGERLINIYAPNGNPADGPKFSYKIKWLEALTARVGALRAARVPLLVAGDFNIIPKDADCHDPAVWAGDALFRPESRAAWRAMRNTGMTDAFRVHTPGAEHYTFWDYQGGAWPQNRGVRIDHVLLAPALADRLASCEIDAEPRGWDTPSDHTPVIVKMDT